MKNIFEETYLNTICKNTNRWDQLKRDFTPQNYSLDKAIMLLNIAIVDEQLAELNYLASYNLSTTQGKNDFDPEFKQHEDEQRAHKHDLINRLRELRSPVPLIGIPDWQSFNSVGLNWKQEFSNNSCDILLHRLHEEQDAIKFYTLCVDFTRNQQDTTTYTLFKKIKQDEEKHIKDLGDLAIEYSLVKSVENPCSNQKNIIPDKQFSKPVVVDQKN